MRNLNEKRGCGSNFPRLFGKLRPDAAGASVQLLERAHQSAAPVLARLSTQNSEKEEVY